MRNRLPLILASRLFGFALWSTLVFAIGGRACSSSFNMGTGAFWWQIYTLYGAAFMVPFVVVIATITYFVVIITRSSHRPVALGIAGALLLAIVFISAVLLTAPNQRCVYP